MIGALGAFFCVDHDELWKGFSDGRDVLVSASADQYLNASRHMLHWIPQLSEETI